MDHARVLAGYVQGTGLGARGDEGGDRENRGAYHRRAIEYGEHPWHDDYIEDQQAKGMISMTMAVGGQALHWGGACNRFSEEDLRLKSLYGLADDWAIDWTQAATQLDAVLGDDAERARRVERAVALDARVHAFRDGRNAERVYRAILAGTAHDGPREGTG